MNSNKHIAINMAYLMSIDTMMSSCQSNDLVEKHDKSHRHFQAMKSKKINRNLLNKNHKSHKRLPHRR